MRPHEMSETKNRTRAFARSELAED